MRFSADAVFLPTSERVSILLAGESEVEGTIQAFSDSGAKSQAFAVVDVVRTETVVVPVEKLELIAGPSAKP